jgi:hypothetical protein
MAPAARLDNMECQLFQRIKNFDRIFNMLSKGHPELTPKPEGISTILHKAANRIAATHLFCKLSSDRDPNHMDQEGMLRYIILGPSGATWRNVNHFRQLMLSEKFQRYDFGPIRNLTEYGQVTPPEYDLSRIENFNIALMCGKEDLLVSPKDYFWL